ncbi:MAG: arginine deiminase-related protein [Steroidobacteraceae bacterium]|nr:arginine deiminase-related protein [Steroidobacteraceae bacterium]MDW8259068.1 arginine deiminase-related protein [Gammaproteobacteria bacterium]
MRQTTDRVLMVRPAAFGFNADTAATNALQQRRAVADPQADACAEFDDLARALANEGVRVAIAADTTPPNRPDAIFPNNWVSFHADGTVVLYPLLAPSRRLERRDAVIEAACAGSGFRIQRRIDLTGFEAEGRFLEGTGSLVLDHVERVASACRSPRTDETLVRRWCDELGYAPQIFDAFDPQGRPYYHTNVILSIGSRFALIAAEQIPPPQRGAVLERLRASGRTIIEIDARAVAEFCGNVLELASWDEALGDIALLVMSQRARSAFGGTQLAQLTAAVDVLLTVPIPTIEALGGGGVRCMLAEIFVA